jgi:hypothetical protein
MKLLAMYYYWVTSHPKADGIKHFAMLTNSMDEQVRQVLESMRSSFPAKMLQVRAGEMAHWFRVPAALPGHLSLTLSTHGRLLTTVCNSNCMRLDTKDRGNAGLFLIPANFSAPSKTKVLL